MWSRKSILLLSSGTGKEAVQVENLHAKPNPARPIDDLNPNVG